MIEAKTEKNENVNRRGYWPVFGGVWQNISTVEILPDERGKLYWLNDGKRDFAIPFVTVERCNESGILETLYDSRYDQPLLETE